MKVAVHAWSLCIIVHVEKILFTLQSKYDYCPTSLSLTQQQYSNSKSGGCTVACDAVCKELLTVANTVHLFEKSIHGLDLMKLFWRPFGQQFIGTIISHIRRQKVSEEGASVLVSDLTEFLNVRECDLFLFLLICMA